MKLYVLIDAYDLPPIEVVLIDTQAARLRERLGQDEALVRAEGPIQPDIVDAVEEFVNALSVFPRPGSGWRGSYDEPTSEQERVEAAHIELKALSPVLATVLKPDMDAWFKTMNEAEYAWEEANL